MDQINIIDNHSLLWGNETLSESVSYILECKLLCYHKNFMHMFLLLPRITRITKNLLFWRGLFHLYGNAPAQEPLHKGS